MKKVLILGNGFDLDLGRKTSYMDFYNSEHCPKDYPAPIIKHLNEKWTDNLEAVKWYDLENEILNYYEKIKALGDNYDLYNATEKEILLQIVNTPTQTTSKIIQDKVEVINRLLTDNILDKSSNGYFRVHPDALLSPVERDKKAVKLIKEGLIEYLKGIERAETNYNSVAMMVVRTFLYNYRDIADYIVYSFNYMDLFHKDEKMVTKLFSRSILVRKLKTLQLKLMVILHSNIKTPLFLIVCLLINTNQKFYTLQMNLLKKSRKLKY